MSEFGVDYQNTDIPDIERTKRFRLFYTLRNLLVLISQLISLRYGLVHIHCSDRFSFYEKSAFMLVCRLFGAPVVMHVHTGRFPEFYKSSKCKWLVRFLIHRSAAVIAVSSEMEHFFQETFKTEVFLVPNCVSPIFFEQDPLPPESRQDILFVGYLNRSKGIFELLEALGQLRNKGYGNLCLVAGGEQVPGSEEMIRSFIRESELEGVELAGQVTPHKVAEFCRHSLVFVLPSHAEGLPISMLEAMACGLPVVASRVGGIPEVVVDRENGLLIPPGDVKALTGALASLLDNPELRIKMGEKNRIKIMEVYIL